MIIDVHAHLGWDYVFDADFTAEELLESQARNGLDATIVQPGSTHAIEQARAQHDAIAALARAHPGRFYGMANPSPHLPAAEYRAELERCVKSLGMRGVQLGSHVNGKNLDDAGIFAVLEAAQELGAAVFVHPWDMMAKERMGKYWLGWLVGWMVTRRP